MTRTWIGIVSAMQYEKRKIRDKVLKVMGLKCTMSLMYNILNILCPNCIMSQMYNVPTAQFLMYTVSNVQCSLSTHTCKYTISQMYNESNIQCIKCTMS